MTRRNLFLIGITLGILVSTHEVFSNECPSLGDFLNDDSQRSLEGSVLPKEAWSEGFRKELSFSIPEDIEGWKILMVFSKPVERLEIWRARVAKIEGGKVFHLTNMPWNKKLPEGNTLTMAFLARFDAGEAPEVCFAYLLWEGTPSPFPQTTEPVKTTEPSTVNPPETNPPSTTQPAPTTEPAATTTQPSVNPSCSKYLELLLEVSNQRSLEGSVLPKEAWSEGFRKELSFAIPEDIEGWKILMVFSKPVKLEIWKAMVAKNNNGKVFHLTNMPWNKNLLKGQKLTMVFLARFDAGEAPEVCFAYLLWEGTPSPFPQTTEPMETTEPSTVNPPETNPPSTTQPAPTTEPAATTAQETTQTAPPTTTERPTTEPAATTAQETTQPAPPTTTQRPTTEPAATTAQETTQPAPPTTTQRPTTEPAATTAQETTQPAPPTTTQRPTTEPAATTTQETTQPAPPTTTQRPTTEPAATTAQETTQPAPPTTTQQPLTEPAATTAQPSIIPSCSKYDYNEVLHKSILFYEAQRSGKLPANNRIPWRGDSALEDKGNAGENLAGGWYDAGDFVKFNFPMAFSTTLLTWGFIEYEKAYSYSGEHDRMLDSIKWPLDYFIKAHVSKSVLYAQVGDGDADHAQWGRPEDMTIARPAFKIDSTKPGSDLAGETSAAMAAASIAFRKTNSQYADTLLGHAKELYEFAQLDRGKYSDSVPQAASFYRSSHYEDELAWAAAWLYKATNDPNYLQKAEKHFAEWPQFQNPAWAFSWDEKTAGVQMLMYDLTGKDMYRQYIERSLNEWLPGGSVQYTPKGLAWRIKWGANRYAANTAFLALLAADKGLKSEAFEQFGRNQIHYMLGDAGRSFVVGFGENPPQRPHHRSSSCPDRPASCTWQNYNQPGPNPQVLNGALVGGPDNDDSYQDRRDDFIKNEVACDYNAGFQSAVAALKAREKCM
ncbi:uncharacterized protein LOC114526577 isoform X2 [Dendronephthya gigantea]|uniref:uncharacterized protein LOC114526577 isoform X2 n=1 Tax=Dendronephthya gigantea TaxID=151771 RepID=UPI00106D9174|nr:uncharacterized protein LOC114526577 isoform X2 [Dendronephthya gigantea]